MIDTDYRRALWLGLFAITVWGGTPIATKLAVASLSPLAVTLWRTLGAAMIAGILALALRPPLPRTRRALLLLLLSAGTGYIAFPWLLALGLRHGSASVAALLIALAPVFTGGLAIAFGRLRVSAAWFAGTGLALIGSIVLLGFDGLNLGSERSSGNLIVLLAVLAAAVGYLCGAEAAREVGAFAVAVWGHLAAALPLLLFLGPATAALTDAGYVPLAWGAIGYLAAFSSLGAYIAWYAALASRPAISQIQFLQGAIGVLLSVALLGEMLEFRVLAAAALILTGVVATQKAVRTAAPPASNSNRGVAP